MKNAIVINGLTGSEKCDVLIYYTYILIMK